MCLRLRVPCQCHQFRTTSKCLCNSLSTTIAQAHVSSLLPRRCSMLHNVLLYRRYLSIISSNNSIYFNISNNRYMDHSVQYTLRTRVRCSRNTVVDLHLTQMLDRPLTTFFTTLHVSRDNCRSALTLQ